MSTDSFIAELETEASATMRRLLRQAYERGFREALAASGQPIAAATVPEASAPEPPPPSASVAPVQDGAPVGLTVDERNETSSPTAIDWDAEGESADKDDGAVDGEAERELRPILPSATVGTLRRRIERTFALERFDIELIICARGDRDRRQLKGPVRLNRYLRRSE